MGFKGLARCCDWSVAREKTEKGTKTLARTPKTITASYGSASHLTIFFV
tara:strand:- start:145 stop:291 length:147 start_codon:yes stop_codon:yes gene_type:complete